MDELKGERNSSALYLAGEPLDMNSYEAIDHPHIIVNGKAAYLKISYKHYFNVVSVHAFWINY